MARINSNIPATIAQANLARANANLELHLQRLSTGIRINRGADDPAGLIISERLRSEISGLKQAVDNSTRASNVIATTEAALTEVSDLLTSIKGLVVQAANTAGISEEERKANQLQINSAIDSITRISNTTSFGNLKLLNGSLDYSLSGVDTTAIGKASITAAGFGGSSSIQVSVQVLTSAQTGGLYLSAGATSGTFASATNLEIAGARGVQTIQIGSGQALSAVVAAVNRFRDSTGVSASLINASDQTSGLRFHTIDFGSNSFVSVKRLGGPAGGGFFRTFRLDDTTALPGTFDWGTLTASLTQSDRDIGRDVGAIINGDLARGQGIKATVTNAAALSAEITLSTSFATTVTGTPTSFYVTGGGALYQLGGDINAGQQTNVGIQSVAASRLGGTVINNSLQFLESLREGGANDLDSGNFVDATAVLNTAIDEVSQLRGRLGAFERNTLETNIRSLQAAIENLTSSESQIRDADFAAETSNLTRAQILNSAATSVLQLANQQAQSVLQLLR